MLRLSDEIGIMADNISLQADKILDTQEAMNGNVAVTQASILHAQKILNRAIRPIEA